MILQWLTFAVMILIQAVAAGVIISAIRTTLASHSEEIKGLRDWRHSFGPKEMVIADHTEQLKDHESRIRLVERKPSEACTTVGCPLRHEAIG